MKSPSDDIARATGACTRTWYRSLAAAGCMGVEITGQDGVDDVLVIDGTGGLPPVDITFVGGDGGNDAIEITGGAFGAVTYTAQGADSGEIDFDGTVTIYYSGLEPITDNANAATRVITMSAAGAQQIRLIDDGTAGNNMTTVDSNGTGGFEQVTFTTPTVSLTINAGDGDDTISVVSVDSSFGAGVAVVINGDAGNDTLVGPAATNTWAVTANDAGTLDPTGIAPTIAFTTIESLSGGSGADTFAFNTPGVQLTRYVNGNAGTDVLNHTGYGATAFQVDNVNGDGYHGREPNSLGGGFEGINTFVPAFAFSVPTLTEWGIIALVLVLALTAVTRLRRRAV